MNTLVTTLAQVRALVLAAAVLLAGFAAVASNAPHDAAAAGPCGLSAQPVLSGGRVDAWGVSNCSHSNYQKVTTEVKRNGVVVASATRYGWSAQMSAHALGTACVRGANYQVVVIHQYGDGRSSAALHSFITTGTPRPLC